MWSTVRAAAECAALPIARFDATELPVRFAGEVRNFDATEYFGPKDARRQDRVTQLGLRGGRRRAGAMPASSVPTRVAAR